MGYNDIIIYLLAIFGGFVVSVILVPLVIKIANKLGIVDNPKAADRKVHQKITPLSGGVAIFVAVFLIIFVFRYFGLANFSRVPDHFLFGVFIASLFIIVGGVLDDKYSLKPWQQIIFPLIASLIVVIVGIKISYVTNPLGDTNSAILYINAFWGTILAFVWLMGMMYTTKFLDGLDGLVGGISVIASFIIFMVSLSWDVPLSATGIWSLALLGGCLGFLIFNYYPAKIFLGESGSIFLGFMIGVLSIISGSKIATTLLVVGIPVLDVLWVIVQRLLKKESPFSHADRKHLHYRLLDLGFSRQGAVWFLYLVSLAFGSLAVVGFGFSKFISFLVLVSLMVVLTIIFYLNNKKNGNPDNGKREKIVGWGIDIITILAFMPIVLGGYFVAHNNLDKKDLIIGDHQVRVEIADNYKTREKGLSGRKSLADGQGMLFIFSDYGRHAFWMKEMNFPLDLIWLRDNRVIGFEPDLPPGGLLPLKDYRPLEDINWVLEVPAGFIAKNNIKIGDSAVIK